MSFSSSVETILDGTFLDVNTTTSIVNMDTKQEDSQSKRTLGQIVYDRRLQRGWTQNDLAEHMDMSQEWVTKIETGRIKAPKLQSLKRLAVVLGINVEVLVIAAGFSDTAKGARAIAESAPDYDPTNLPPHLRASFLRVGTLSPTAQKKLETFLDDLFLLEDFQNTKNSR